MRLNCLKIERDKALLWSGFMNIQISTLRIVVIILLQQLRFMQRFKSICLLELINQKLAPQALEGSQQFVN